MRFVGIGVAALLMVGLAGVPAQAASTGVASVVQGTKIRYKAATGKQNRVTITRSGNTITVDDVVTVKAGKGCKQVKGDKTRVRCTPTKAPTRIQVWTYDRNDTIVNRTDVGMTADGGAGADRITGGSRSDRLEGGDGADRLWGLGGKDYLHGSDGNEVLSGGDGDDWVEGGHGNDRLYGGNGHDSIHGMNGDDRMWGGAGDDTFFMDQATFGSDDDWISGGAGERDSVTYVNYAKAITADADGVKGDDGAKGEHDTIGTDVEEIQGGDGDDRIYGTPRADYLYGAGGNDVIHGYGGDDLLAGEHGKDKLYGGAGDDYLRGDDWGIKGGQDLLDGGPASDLCEAAGGDVKVSCER
ncbi:calcium-binding protein [Actinoplanes couchii]|uniref:Hemolysin-type calcium-binding region n=1 Tax=Actinoplanes couchii TaxID=403638 RepID=A0ABQ3XJ39_9ACTN|nr:calcium-binding protein [Actinoplanes couchii]MDR6324491.1 Ca2+-binding RTX toxin-like protein [Actinoplanes couchii]GID58510.1 hypothetical protein Aco03nite_069140 [Actinoplanes couchii]